MVKKIKITENQLKEVNPYLRTMWQLIENRKTLHRDIINAEVFPYSKGQICVNGQKYIIEGLITTYPTPKTIDYLKNELKKNNVPIDNLDVRYDPQYYKGEIDVANFINVIIDSYVLTQEIYDKVVKIFDTCGYFLSVNYWTDDRSKFVYQFEPKYKDEKNDLQKISRYIYHVTTKNSAMKIQKRGFIPRAKNNAFNYPPRCYFFTYPDYGFMYDFMVGSSKVKDGDDCYVLVIDVSRLRKDIKFWKDPLFLANDIAVYTYDNIPYSAVVDVVRINETQ